MNSFSHSQNDILADSTFTEGLNDILLKANTTQFEYIAKSAKEVKICVDKSSTELNSNLDTINEDECDDATPVENPSTVSCINGIILVTPLDDIPEGYTVIRETIGGHSANLNLYGKGKDRYLAISHDVPNTLPITDMTCTYCSLNEEHPPGFLNVSGAPKSRNGQFNKNPKGNRLNICVSRDSRLPPVCDIIIVNVSEGEEIPSGYNAIMITPLGFTANIYNGKKHQEAYICFKRDLSCLDILKKNEYVDLPVVPQKSEHKQLSINMSMSEISYAVDKKLVCSYNTYNEQAKQLYYLHPFLYAMLSGNPELMNIALSRFRILVTKRYFSTSDISPLMELCVPIFCRSCMTLLTAVNIQLKSFIRDLLSSDLRSTFCLQSMWETLMECYISFHEHEVIFEIQCNNNDSQAHNHVNRSISWSRELIACKADKQAALQDILDATDILATRINQSEKEMELFSTNDQNFIINLTDQIETEAIISVTLTKAFSYLSRISPFNNTALLSDVIPLFTKISIDSAQVNLMLPLLISIQYARLPIKQNKRNVLRRLVALEVIKHHLSLENPFYNKTLSHEFVRAIIVPSVLINFKGDTISHPEIFNQVIEIMRLLTDNYYKAMPLRIGVTWNELFNNFLTCNLIDDSFKIPVIREYQHLFSDPEKLAFFYRAFDNDYNSLLVVIKDGIQKLSKLILPTDDSDTTITQESQSYQVIYETMKCFTAFCHSLMKLAQEYKNSEKVNKERSNSSYTTITIYDSLDSEHLNNFRKTFSDELTEDISKGTTHKTAASKRETKEVDFVNNVMYALKTIADREDVTKGIQYLEKSNDIKHVPEDICRFIWKYKTQIDPRFIGDYIGKEGGFGEEHFYKQIRYSYIRGLDFTGLDIVSAMRILLTKGGFFLPGEGQKIDRIIEEFSHCYYENNPNSFENEDVIYVVAYSIVMCNTDLHNTKLKEHMDIDGYISLVKGETACQNIKNQVLIDIYNSIYNEEIYIPGFKGDVDDSNAPTISNDILLQEFMDNHVNSALALLRNNRYTAPIVNDLYDLTVLMIQKLSFIITEDLLHIISHTNDSQLLKLCIECLHDLYIASLLTETYGYLKICNRLLSDIYWKGYHLENIMFEPDIIKSLKFDSSNMNTTISILTSVSMTLNKLVDESTDINGPQQLKRFVELDELIYSKYIYKSSLIKICSTGKHKSYTFYLFPNCLVYASSALFSTKKTIHLAIPLTSLKVTPEENGFYIESDKKSFHILCDKDEKKKWLTNIETTKNKLFSGSL